MVLGFLILYASRIQTIQVANLCCVLLFRLLLFSRSCFCFWVASSRFRLLIPHLSHAYLNLVPLSFISLIVTAMNDIQVIGPFAVSGQQDVHKSTQVLADISAAGYSMPDRDYYLKPDARFKEARAKYIDHVARMFALAGWDAKSAAAAAQTVLTME